MEHPKFKMRASMAGELLVDGKNEHKIGAGALSYVEKYLLERYLGYRNEITAYTLERGNFYEAQAISLLSEYLYGFDQLEKNQEHREDDHFTGTCDVLDGDTTYDTKVPKSSDTMPYAATKIDRDYFAQGQVYMELFGAVKHCIAYCLMPEGFDEEKDQIIEALPLKKRVVLHKFGKSDDFISMMRRKVEAINEIYVPQIWAELQNNERDF
jgi:hypothetical protein